MPWRVKIIKSSADDLVIQEKKEVLPERILANHCRFMATTQGKQTEPYLLNVLRRTYKLGRSLNLKFENFPDEFRTDKLKKALEWLEANPPEKKVR